MKKIAVFILFLVLILVAHSVVQHLRASAQSTSACQYPARPLNPNGTCDNTDPCDPANKTGECKDQGACSNTNPLSRCYNDKPSITPPPENDTGALK